MNRVQLLEELLAKANCPECDGSGTVVEEVTVPDCCRSPLSTGECCGNPVPALEQVTHECMWCHNRRYVLDQD